MSEDKPLRFSNVQLKNWKNFAFCDVAVGRRAFLVGPNAAGKSNFLDVFRFLRDLASSGGGFQQAITRRGGVSAIRSLAARRASDIELNVSAVGAEGTPRWEYELAFNQDKQRRARIERERIVRDGETLLTRPDDGDKVDPDRLSQTHLEQVNVNRAFRDLVSFFESIR
jgi:predicted ATPase